MVLTFHINGTYSLYCILYQLSIWCSRGRETCFFCFLNIGKSVTLYAIHNQYRPKYKNANYFPSCDWLFEKVIAIIQQWWGMIMYDSSYTIRPTSLPIIPILNIYIYDLSSGLPQEIQCGVVTTRSIFPNCLTTNEACGVCREFQFCFMLSCRQCSARCEIAMN